MLELDADVLARTGAPSQFDLVVAVGNVMIFLAEGTEVAVLTRFRDLLAPGGRVLVGFHPAGGPTTSREYAPAEFARDAAAAGLQLDAHFGSYELQPPGPGYAVLLLSRADDEGLEDPEPEGHPTWAGG